MAAEIAVLKAGYVFMHFGQKGRKAIAARPQDSGREKDPDYAFPASDPRISGQEFKFTFTRRIAGGGAGVVNKTKKKRAPVNAEAAPDEQEEDPFESLDTASEDELDAAEEQIARASEDEEDLEGEDAEEPESEEDAGYDDDDEEEEDPLAGLM